MCLLVETHSVIETLLQLSLRPISNESTKDIKKPLVTGSKDPSVAQGNSEDQGSGTSEAKPVVSVSSTQLVYAVADLDRLQEQVSLHKGESKCGVQCSHCCGAPRENTWFISLLSVPPTPPTGALPPVAPQSRPSRTVLAQSLCFPPGVSFRAGSKPGATGFFISLVFSVQDGLWWVGF